MLYLGSNEYGGQHSVDNQQQVENMSLYVLVCDDESHITRTIAYRLQKSGFRVESVENGSQAWEAIQREAPAVLICDYQMPHMDGLELCRLLREDFRYADLPIVLLTAKGYEISAHQLQRDLRLSAVLGKPFSPRELLTLVQLLTGSEEKVA